MKMLKVVLKTFAFMFIICVAALFGTIALLFATSDYDESWQICCEGVPEYDLSGTEVEL